MARTHVFMVHEGRLFMPLKWTGIHPLCWLVDGLPVAFFGKRKKTYVDVSLVIDWHKKELESSKGKSGDAKVLEMLTKAFSDFKEGLLPIDDPGPPKKRQPRHRS